MATLEKEKVERKELNEKKVVAVIDWITEQHPMKVLRYNGFVFFCKLPVIIISKEEREEISDTNITSMFLTATVLTVYRDATLASWWNAATDRMLMTACTFNNAMAQCWPSSLETNDPSTEPDKSAN